MSITPEELAEGTTTTVRIQHRATGAAPYRWFCPTHAAARAASNSSRMRSTGPWNTAHGARGGAIRHLIERHGTPPAIAAREVTEAVYEELSLDEAAATPSAARDQILSAATGSGWKVEPGPTVGSLFIHPPTTRLPCATIAFTRNGSIATIEFNALRSLSGRDKLAQVLDFLAKNGRATA